MNTTEKLLIEDAQDQIKAFKEHLENARLENAALRLEVERLKGDLKGMKLEDNLKPRFWPLFSEALGNGIRGGLYKASKRDLIELPESEETISRIVDVIENYIAISIEETFEVGDDTDEEDKV